ncbi:cutinase family protein [Mycobacterium sp.]|uniref:cutinase family protein n=1 Tax=Mycobacterium sp. TaxID=1785 RepID=UPI003A860158
MASNARNKRRRRLAWLAAASMALAVALAIVGGVMVLRNRDVSPSAVPPGVLPPGSTNPKPRKPRPAFQDASCPDVQLISVPGTWESSPTDPPLHPIQFPMALLLKVTGPIGEEFDGGRVQTYTVPYTAQFRHPFSGDTELTYNASRAEGTQATVRALTEMNNQCPLTSYVLIGFSQGAVIAGDVAGDIGNGLGPVDEDLVLGVTLIADGRRQAGVGNTIPPSPPGVGAEITLHEVPVLSNLGLTMTGERPGGFGALDRRTNEICAVGDLICAAPKEAFSPANLPATLDMLAGGASHPVHAMYATTDFWSSNGESATQWTLDWVRGIIESAPHPRHR